MCLFALQSHLSSLLRAGGEQFLPILFVTKCKSSYKKLKNQINLTKSYENAKKNDN